MAGPDFNGKVALITGGANGIGRATAEKLVACGATVVIGDRDSAAAESVAATLGLSCSAKFFDATSQRSIRSLAEATYQRHGAIDVLLNNVAITTDAWSTDTTVLDTDLEVWDRTMQVNLRSMFVASKAVLPYMLAAGDGVILNMASAAGMAGGDSLVAYGTSKAAVIGFTRYLAVQYGASGVRSNAISPGTILTQQLLDNSGGAEKTALQNIPASRLGQPEDIADLVAYLASESGSFINGQNIPCDGGRTARSAG